MSEQTRLLELVQRYVDGRATSDETSDLESLLQGDVEARRVFRSYMELDAALERVAAVGRELAPLKVEETEMLTPTKLVAEVVRLKTVVHSGPNSDEFGYPSARRLISIAVAVVAMVAASAVWIARGNSVAWATVVESGPGVSIESNGKSRPARPGDRLRVGESINVTDDATARVRLADFGSAMLGPSTRLQRSREGRLMDLISGSAEIAVDQHSEGKTWRIRTPQAEAAVSANEFNIASCAGRTALRVTDGHVHLMSLKSGAHEEVRGGNRAIVEENSSPVVSSSRPGSALVITSRKPVHADWERFNQLVSERLLNARLWQMGFRVDVRHFEDVQPSDLADRAIVIVSLFDYGVGEPAIERIDLAHADVPMICLEPAGYPQLGMTDAREGTGFAFRSGKSAVKFVAPNHPLAAKLDGMRDGLLRGIIGWGRPLDSATLIAHLPEHPEHAIVFAYDAQQMLNNFPAPARRVGLFLDPSSISEQSHDSWRLLEAAVNWCVEIDGTETKSKGTL